MKNEKKKTDEEIVKSIFDEIQKTVMKELVREEVMPLHISAALLFSLSKSLVSEACAHKATYGTDPEKRISKQINILHEEALQELKERLSHGEE